MYRERDCINSFIIDDNLFKIICNKYILVLSIINGSINIPIINENDEDIGLSELNENDNIVFLFREINKNIIKPIKIIKHFNYELLMSSDEDEFNY